MTDILEGIEGTLSFAVARMRAIARLVRTPQFEIDLPDASLIFAFHCVRISDTTDSGSEM